MKYGRSDIRHNLKHFTAERMEQKAGMTLLWFFLVTILILAVTGSCLVLGIVKGLIETAPDITNLNTAPVESATYIYDSNGNEIQKLNAPTSNRIPVSINEISIYLQHAIVAIEDERFYEHNGIDVQGIMRAFVVGIKNQYFSEGASTITQQLLKNSVFTSWTNESSLVESFKRKFQEQYLAIKLEDYLEEGQDKASAKQKILEDYLNTVNFGAGTYGVQAAAQRYFSKDASALTLSEATVIAGITQNPTAYNPILYPKNNAARRKQVLNSMLKQGYITTSQFDEALSDPVYDRIQDVDATDTDASVYSYYTDALIDQVLDDLVNIAGYTSTQASHALYSGGLKIYSAQDSAIQQICDEEFANPANYPSETRIGLDYALSIIDKNGKTIHYSSQDLSNYFRKSIPDFTLMFSDEAQARQYANAFRKTIVTESTTVLGERITLVPQPQASAVIIDQETGYVIAIVGGRGKKDASLVLNRATASRRQPGSTFKPLAVYAPAIEAGILTLATVYENAPYSYSSGQDILNWDDLYNGYETVHSAITRSVNVVAIKALEDYSPQDALDTLESLGFTTLYNGDQDEDGNILTDAFLPLALGGVTDGVVNLELTAAYAALANGGSYIAPKFYTKVEDSKGNIILDNSSQRYRVFSEETSYLITSAMKSVISDPQGTAYEYIGLNGMPACGKSGTTDSAKDIWFEGYTPYYTCGIWGGYDSNEPLPDDDKTYHAYAKILWNSIMNRIHENLPVKDFEMPDDIVTVQICSKSGELAVPGLCDCDPRGSAIVTEYFKEKTVPKTSCSMHTQVTLCSQTGLIASKSCTDTYTGIYLDLPEESSTETTDWQYRMPQEQCPGHISKPVSAVSSQKRETETETAATEKKAETSSAPSEGTIVVDGQVVNENSYFQSNPDLDQEGVFYYDDSGNTDGYSSNSETVDGSSYDYNYDSSGYNYEYDSSGSYNFDSMYDDDYDFDSIPADNYYNDGINVY